MEKTKALGRRQYDGLQIGRALAALSVVFTHAIAHPFAGAPGLSHMLGRYGVTLFFVISGFIMVATTGSGRFDPKAFLVRRLKRIVPIYFVANFILLLIVLVAPSIFKSTLLDWPHIFLSLFFIPQFEPNGSGYIWPFFRLGWTLNYEMFFYLCFAAFFMVAAQRRAIGISLLFIGLFALGQNVAFVGAPAIFYTQVDILGFIAGVWLGYLTLSKPLHMSAAMASILFWASLLILLVVAIYYPQIRAIPVTQIWMIAACALQVTLLLWYYDSGRVSAPRSLLLLGDASYSVYLFHMFGVGAVTAIAKMLPVPFLYLLMPVSAAIGVIGGLIIYWLVEKPVQNFFKTGHFTVPVIFALKRAD